MIKDTHIREDVERELFYTLGPDAARIGVAVEDGIVTLSGCVDLYDRKLKVLRAAGRVANVRAVACQVQVRLPGPQPLTDSELARTVANVLAWNSVIPENRLRVRVENGWVTLEGTVDWQYQKDTAAATLGEVTGVRGVDNLVTVNPALSSEDVKQKIEAALRADPAIDDRNILVEVSNDRVVLHGEARSVAEREEAERIAWAAPGVADVANHVVLAETVSSVR